MSAKSLVWSPYTCRTRAKDRLRLVCNLFVVDVTQVLEKVVQYHCFPQTEVLCGGKLKRVLVIREGVRDRESNGLTLRSLSTAYGFHSCEVHSEFGIQNKAKVLKLGDFVDRVRARV